MIDIFSLIDIKYVACNILATFVVLSYCIANPKKWLRIILSLIIGISSGLLWYYKLNITIDVLVLSYLFAQVAYSWGIKSIMDKIGTTYDNNKGITI